MARSKKQQSRKSKKGGTTTSDSASAPAAPAAAPAATAATTAPAAPAFDSATKKQQLNDRLSKITPGFMSFLKFTKTALDDKAATSLAAAKTAVDAVTDETTYNTADAAVKKAEDDFKAANPTAAATPATVGGKRKSQKKAQKKSRKSRRR